MIQRMILCNFLFFFNRKNEFLVYFVFWCRYSGLHEQFRHNGTRSNLWHKRTLDCYHESYEEMQQQHKKLLQWTRRPALKIPVLQRNEGKLQSKTISPLNYAEKKSRKPHVILEIHNLTDRHLEGYFPTHLETRPAPWSFTSYKISKPPATFAVCSVKRMQFGMGRTNHW